MHFIIAFFTAFLITFILLPVVIKVSKRIDILDLPNNRKVHSVSTPSMGGIGMFVGFTIAIVVSLTFSELASLKYFLVGILLIFILGLRDDIADLKARHKLTIQIFSSLFIVYVGGIRLTGLYGIFGINEFPLLISGGFSVLVIVAITNAFNLIDGIDGLAASLGVIGLLFFGLVFYANDNLPLSYICFSVIGALIAFLFYNWHPSSIFMGDTGSMVLGFILIVLGINLVNIDTELVVFSSMEISSPISVVFATLIIPIYDTSRVFTIRLSKKISPFVPDRNHVHHALLRTGLSHSNASISLALLNVLSILIAVALNNYLGQGVLILLVFSLAVIFGLIVDKLAKNKKSATLETTNNSQKSLYISKSA